MSRRSRDKGARGELEVVHLLAEHGLEAFRTAPLQSGGAPGADVSVTLTPWVHVEVKRDEKMSPEAMLRQAERDAPEGSFPLVAWRRNGEEWKATCRLDTLLTWFVRPCRDMSDMPVHSTEYI